MKSTGDRPGHNYAIATWVPSLADRAHLVLRRLAELLFGKNHN